MKNSLAREHRVTTATNNSALLQRGGLKQSCNSHFSDPSWRPLRIVAEPFFRLFHDCCGSLRRRVSHRAATAQQVPIRGPVLLRALGGPPKTTRFTPRPGALGMGL